MRHSATRTRTVHPVLRFIGRFFAVLGVTVLGIALTLLGAIWTFTKGPSPTARNEFVSTMTETSALKFIPHIFLSNAEVDEILNGNIIVETDETTDTSVDFTEKDETAEPLELIDIAGPTYSGKLLIVQDPSRVKVACLPYFSEEVDGRTTEGFVKRSGAVAGINGGGFVDTNGFGSGGMPTGIVIKDGKLVCGSSSTVSSVIAFDNNNHLVVGQMSGADALAKGVRDAVSFGPALIINGEPAEVSGSGGGVNPRTVLGQRADGAVLMLVIDGRQAHSLGATYKDCIEVMLQYGAINAGNLDGGSSTTLVYNGEVVNSCAALQGARYIPTAFVVM